MLMTGKRRLPFESARTSKATRCYILHISQPHTEGTAYAFTELPGRVASAFFHLSFLSAVPLSRFGAPPHCCVCP